MSSFCTRLLGSDADIAGANEAGGVAGPRVLILRVNAADEVRAAGLFLQMDIR